MAKRSALRKRNSRRMAPTGPGIERARAWIATAINPVLAGVRAERPWVEERNFTWVHTRRDFERLAPIAAYVDPRYFDNFLDFLNKRAWASELVQRHDAHLDELRVILTKWHEVLVTGDFRNAAIRLISLERQEPERRKGVDELDITLVSYFADHCINNRTEVSDLYSWADFWRRHGKSLLEVAKQADRRAAEASENLAKALIVDIDASDSRFEQCRRELADQYGLAVVPVEHG